MDQEMKVDVPKDVVTYVVSQDIGRQVISLRMKGALNEPIF